MPRALQKVPGGGVVGCGGVGWLRPILVFSLSLSQAEQLLKAQILPHANCEDSNYNRNMKLFNIQALYVVSYTFK